MGLWYSIFVAKYKNKRVAPLTIITLACLVLVLVLSAIGFIYTKNDQTAIIKSADQFKWQEFSDPSSGLSFKYPKIWGDAKVDSWPKGTVISLKDDSFAIELLSSSLTIDPKTKRVLSPTEIIDENYNAHLKETDVSDLEKDTITLDKRSAVRITYLSTAYPVKSRVVGVSLRKSYRDEFFSLYYVYPVAQENDESVILSQILASLKFNPSE